MQMIDDDDWEADQILVLHVTYDNLDDKADNNDDGNEDEADQIFVLHAASDELVFGQTAVACCGMLLTFIYFAMVDD